MRRSPDLVIVPFFALLALTMGAVSPARCQDIPPERQLELASGLARELGFVDLAEKVVDELSREHADTLPPEKLAFTRAELYTEAIKSAGTKINSGDPAVRGEAYKTYVAAYNRAIDAWNDYLASPHERKAEAASTMLRLVQEKLNRVISWMQTDDDMPDEVRTHLIDVALESENSANRRWMAAIRHAEEEILRIETRVDDLYDNLSGDPDKDKASMDEIDRVLVSLFRLLFDKGEVYLSESKLYAIRDGAQNQDSADFLDAAYRSYRKLSDQAGDNSNTGLLATARQAECLLLKGKIKSSLRYFRRVFYAAVPLVKNKRTHKFDLGNLNLATLKQSRQEWGMNDAQFQSYLRERRRPMCLAFETAIRLFRERGFLPEALEIANDFLLVRKRWRTSLELPELYLRELGNFEEAYRATLETGICLSLVGRTAEAIDLVTAVVHRNVDERILRPTSFLGRKALSAIAAIAAIAPEEMLSADDYLWAGISAYLDKDQEACLRFMRRALRRFAERGGGEGSLTELETRLTWCYIHMGRSLHMLAQAGDKRGYLAIMAMRHPALYFMDQDERYAGMDVPTCIATNSYRVWSSQLERSSATDKAMAMAWKDEASLLRRVRCNAGHEEGEMAEAIKYFNASNFPLCRNHIKEITNEEHRVYFQSRVLAGMCDWEEKQYAAVITSMDKALASLEKNKAAAKAKGKIFRARSEGQYREKALYYRGRARYELARRETSESAKSPLRKNGIHDLLSAAEKPIDTRLAATALHYAVRMMCAEKMKEQAEQTFARLEKIAKGQPSLIARPAYDIYRLVKPPIKGLDTTASLDAVFDAKVYAQLREAVTYLAKVNQGTRPRYPNLLQEAKMLTELAKTGDTAAARAARDKWKNLQENYPAEGKRKAKNGRSFAEEVARVSMLIGTRADFEVAAKIFHEKVFFASANDPEWTNEAKKMSIQVGSERESYYLRPKATTADLQLCAMAYVGWVQPNFQNPLQPPLRTKGLSQWLFESKPTGEARVKLLRAHQLGTNVWGYLQALKGGKIDEEYLQIRLNYDFAKAYFAKRINPNPRDSSAILVALNSLRDSILQAGAEWERIGKCLLDKQGKPLLSPDHAKAWSKTLLWLEGYLRE